MSSGDESDVVSERETQFVYQSGDDDILWTVQEITAERGNKYKVKWAGVDPSTGEPWAESWVLKHDCTDDLVVEWKKKKKKKNAAGGRKRGASRRFVATADRVWAEHGPTDRGVGVGRPRSSTSRTSGMSKRAGSAAMTTEAKTRRSTSSRIESVEQAPPPKSATKRRLLSESAGTASTSVSVHEEQHAESSRPRKKQRTMVEEFLLPVSSDEEDVMVVSTAREKDARKKNGGPSTSESHSPRVDVEESSLPKAKPKADRLPDARSKAIVGSSRTTNVREQSRAARSKTKAKAFSELRQRVIVDHWLTESDEDEEDKELRPPGLNKKSVLEDKVPAKQTDDLPEKEAELPVLPIKIGPPRGAKPREKKKSRVSSKPGSSRVKLRGDKSDDERPPAKGPSGCVDQQFSFFGTPLPPQRNKVDNHPSPARRIFTPDVSPSKRPRDPDLSPGTRVRLEIFDWMMTESDTTSAPDDAHFNFDNVHDNGPSEILDLPPLDLSPPSPDPKHPKPKTPNGLIVPETESSGNSQSQPQSQPSLMPPPPPPPQPSPPRVPSSHKPMDLPAMAVIASVASSSTSPQDPPPRKLPPLTNLPSKKRLFRGARFANSARPRIADSDPPPSSIESFTSPKRVDKGKQRAVEDNQPVSEGEGGDQRQLKPTQRKITDSELRKRGKELFDQAQSTRKAEWQKIKKPKRLKTVNEIVNGTVPSSLSKGSALLPAGGTENTLELRLEDVVDLGGGNSTTLDTQEHSEAKPTNEQDRDRLRIELRQEEEESTQEAVGVYPPPAQEPEVSHAEDVQMPPPRSPKNSSIGGQMELDHVDQPSTDLVQASVIVQASQEPQHEDIDIGPSLANHATSSPARPVPENLTDSPKRRLGEALSLLNVKSEEIQRLERELADERKNLQGLKTELAELRESLEPTGPVRAAWDAERARWTEERTKWQSDVSTWETQHKETSEEKASLTARLAELSGAAARAEEAGLKISELEAERVAWIKERDVMLKEMAQRSEELGAHAKVCGEHDGERSRWEAEKTRWAEEKTRWETERTAFQERQETLSRSVDELTASAESMRAAKDSAEKDREFFREQYQQASLFVGSVRDENVELEKRVSIAEGQAQEGVAAIKALFEGRVKALQADIDRWKGLTELLQEKDRRTNDELRLRAAQMPELVELCGRLKEENKSLDADARKLGQSQQRAIHQRNRLFYEILLLKKERASLRLKLSKRTKAPDNCTSIEEMSLPAAALAAIEDLDDIDTNDMDILPDSTPHSADTTFDEPALFPCMWRPQWRDQCQQVFDTKEDLERHMQEHYRDLLDPVALS